MQLRLLTAFYLLMYLPVRKLYSATTFFEPIAIVVSGGQKAVTEGVDITVDKDNTIYSIAVKSGTSVFNADSRKRQEQNFQSAQKRAQQAHKAFIPVVGYGYGKKKVKAENEKFYKELAGKDFWEWLTGDPTSTPKSSLTWVLSQMSLPPALRIPTTKLKIV